MSKFFEPVRNFLGLKHLTTTAYHTDSNGQAEHHNKMLIAILHHHLAEHQRYWDVSCSRSPTNITRRSLARPGRNLSDLYYRDIHLAQSLPRPSALLTNASSVTVPSVPRSNLLHHIAVMQKKLDQKLTAAHRRYKIVMIVSYTPQLFSNLVSGSMSSTHC